ncbi:MAG: outer membrane protein assembly factor BamE [Rhodobacteraceae bacterium]|jgi:outer membrane protein assembly factor BamE (lipoprotein component of BamABCDE complex)|nr:outer membrane protein assembly factor BamE [Paracoccaceae bacterium]
MRALALGLLLVAAGCAPMFRNHGYVPPQEALDAVVVGVDTRDSIGETLGRPSAAGIMADSGWYYVESRWKHYGARAPEEIDRQVVAISFDTAGVVTDIERFGLEDGRVVRLSGRLTESSIREVSFLRQLYRNFGRINPGDFFRR